MTKAKYKKIKVRFHVTDFNDNLYRKIEQLKRNNEIDDVFDTFFSDDKKLDLKTHLEKLKNIKQLDSDSSNELYEITLKIKL
ncbi:MAG: hypothetical protein PHV42_04550 [Candidatus Pacebacteria bacterium]|nr:hypothetical protein [Candidatus Paceibacterota bacterium]